MTTEPAAPTAWTAEPVARSADVAGSGNFLQGCQFSPDGLCVATHSVADGRLRLYNTPTSAACTAIGSSSDDDDNDSENAKATTDICWKTALSIDAGDSVRSYTWYPTMDSANPATCCFLATARDQPVHLYDAYSGTVRATYRPYNALDELEAPNVVRFSPDGQQILATGFRTDRTLHVFDTAIPGRTSKTVLRFGKTRRSSDGQKGLASAVSFGGAGTAANSPTVAVGTYAPGSIYIYDLRAGELPAGTVLQGLCVVGHGKGQSLRKKRRFVDATATATGDNTNGSSQNQHSNNNLSDDGNDANWFSDAKARWFRSKAQGGVTQLEFAPGSSGGGDSSSYILYSASRRSNCVIAWDLRMMSGHPDYQSNPIRGLASYTTNNDTNQRIEFDLDSNGETLYVGSLDGCVNAYDLKSGKCTGSIASGLDRGVVANGVSHAYQRNGDSYLAVATGARQFPSEADIENERSLANEAAGNLHLFMIKGMTNK